MKSYQRYLFAIIALTFSIIPAAAEEYILFTPMGDLNTYLINRGGELVHKWTSKYIPGVAVSLEENNCLLRAESIKSPFFAKGGGPGGRIALYDWDGREIWSFKYASNLYLPHHDILALPNGNILAIVWIKHSPGELREKGFDLNSWKANEFWSDAVLEFNPHSGEVVWEWKSFDHSIQNIDENLENYGQISKNPGKININIPLGPNNFDWIHLNALDYNPELDHILLSAHNFNEIWIIDHGISSREAAGEKGDLIYRWGNPMSYGRGGPAGQKLFLQHDSHWLDNGNILVFNNGMRRVREYSTVIEIAPPIDGSGGYSVTESGCFGPEDFYWEYKPGEEDKFFAAYISSSQRLDNGNTFICNGPAGKFFEINMDNEIVWEYSSPYFVKTVFGSSNAVYRATVYDLDL